MLFSMLIISISGSMILIIKAVYANTGIFLRLDKLSESHIKDYLEKCYSIVDVDCGMVITKSYIDREII
jgi:hypothetical protein